MIFSKSLFGDSLRRLVVGACTAMMILPMTPLLSPQAQEARADPICSLAEPGDTRCSEYTAMRQDLAMVAFGQGWVESDLAWRLNGTLIPGQAISGSTPSGAVFTFTAEWFTAGGLMETGIDPQDLPWHVEHATTIRVVIGTLGGPAGTVELLATVVSAIDDNGDAVVLMFPVLFGSVIDDPLALRPGFPTTQPPHDPGVPEQAENPIPPHIILPVDKCGLCWDDYSDAMTAAQSRFNDDVDAALRAAQTRRDTAGTTFRNSETAAKNARNNALVNVALMVGAALLLGYLRTVVTGGWLAPLALIGLFVSVGGALRSASSIYSTYTAAIRAAYATLNARMAEIEQDLQDKLAELQNTYQREKDDAERELRNCLASHGCSPPPDLR